MISSVIKNVHGNTLDLLGEAVVSGRYPCGSTLPPEPVLGESLGVSRTVVREAIKSLIAKGLVTTGPKVGTRVQSEDRWNWFDPDVITWRSKAGITPEFLRDLQDLRRIVEPAAVRLAAERATAQDVADLEAAFAGMEHALRYGGDYVTHDLLFHQGLLRAGGNRLLLHMSKALSALLRISFDLSTRKKDGPLRSLPLHRNVLDAVVARDPGRAEKAIRVLIEGAHQDIQDVLSRGLRTRTRSTAGPLKPAKRRKAA
jgi:DNA-binding FadR family transcriptional regulator